MEAIFAKIAKVENRTTVQRFCYIFEVLGALVGASWALFWAILATSSAILDNIGLKMESVGQDVGIKMAKMSCILTPSLARLGSLLVARACETWFGMERKERER